MYGRGRRLSFKKLGIEYNESKIKLPLAVIRDSLKREKNALASASQSEAEEEEVEKEEDEGENEDESLSVRRFSSKPLRWHFRRPVFRLRHF